MTDSWDTSGDSPWATLWKGSTRRVTLTRAEVGPFSTVTMRKKLTFAETPVQGPEMVKVGLKLVFLPPRARPLAITLSCCLLQCQRNLRTWYESAFRHRWIPFYLPHQPGQWPRSENRTSDGLLWKHICNYNWVDSQKCGLGLERPSGFQAKAMEKTDDATDILREWPWRRGRIPWGGGGLHQAWISIFWILLFLLPPLLFCWSRCSSGFSKKSLGFCIPICHLKPFFSIFILDW